MCPECGKEFVGRSDKLYCSLICKDGHHNSEKKRMIILCPRAYDYVIGLAGAWSETKHVVGNKLILKQANPDGQPLTSEEATGINGLMTP